MADGVEAFSLDLPTLLQQAERHIHNDNLNIVEYFRRRLDDNYTALRIIVMHCIEQNICYEVTVGTREMFSLSKLRPNIIQNIFKRSRIISRQVSTWGQLTNAFDGKHARFVLPKTTGLFGVAELQDSSGFDVLCADAVRKSQGLVDDALKISNDVIHKRDFAVNLIKKFDHLSNTLCNVADLAEFVRLSHPDQEYRRKAGEASLSVNAFVEKLNTNVDLYNALSDVLRTTSSLELDEETQHVADSLKFDFEQSGIHLDKEKRQTFVELQDKILRLGSQFVAGSSAPALLPKTLWPSNVRHNFQFSNEYIMIDGLCYDSPDHQLRELAYKAYMYPNPSQLSVLDNLLQARNDLAELVGFPSFLNRALCGTMAKTPEAVYQFLSLLAEKIHPIASRENELLLQFKSSNSSGKKDAVIMPWDTQYYTSLAKSQLAHKHAVALSEYFSLGTCMEGLNMIFRHIYGITLEATEAEPGELWHPHVIKLTIKHEDEGTLGFIYCDLYYRPSKVQQDCHFTIRGGCQLPDGSYQLPVVCIVCNFPSPQYNNVTLLSHSMIENLFHEMGHAMHSMLGRTNYQHVTGTRMATDLVETPSIFMEYYVWDATILSKFARHYRKGKPLPNEAVTELCKSRNLFSSLEMQTQIFYSMIDYQYHDKHPLGRSTTDILRDLQQQYVSTPYIEGTAWQQRFSHLHGGYAGRYYSYLWCRAVASRIWNEWFSKNPLSRGAGERFRQTFLKYGGGHDARDLVEDMLAQEISVNDLVNALYGELRRTTI